MIDISDLILLSAILFLIPAYIQMRNFYLVRSNSYLIFSLIFIFSIVDSISTIYIDDYFIADILVSISFVIINLILIQLGSEMVNHKLPIASKNWKLFGILTGLGLIGLKLAIKTNVIDERFIILKYLIGEPLRILAGIILIYSIRRTKLVIITQRTNFIEKGWLLVGIIVTITGIIQFISFSVDVISEIIDIKVESYSNLAESASVFASIFLSAFTAILALFYPEAMLLSHHQVIKAAKLYDIISKTNDQGDEFLTKLIFRTEPPEALLDYVKNIPKDILDSLEKSNEEL